MSISIKRQSERGQKQTVRRPRWILWVLALGQLPVTLGVIAFLVLVLTSFQYQGIPLQKLGLYVAISDSLESFRAYRFPVRHWLGLAEEMPTLYLDVKQENYRALEYAAEYDVAVNDRLVDGENIRRDIFVKAELRKDSDSYPVKIRLKGDRRIHWATPKQWSFRVELRDNNSLFGMRKFSLQKPVVRNYVYEWFFHKILKREGIIGLRYDFVNLYVNGKSQGVYAVEEHFDKILLENNNRREAPILRFTEDGMTIDNDWYQMPPSAYGEKRWLERNPQMLAQATGLLENFQFGRKSIGEVFDVQLLARYFAIVDLLDSFHAALAKSIKFYYNPINRKLEPIGFDAQFNDRRMPVLVAELSDFRAIGGYSNADYYNAMFGPDINNKVQFWEAYIQELERLSKPEYLDGVFADLGPELDEKLDQLYSELPIHAVITGHPLTTGPRLLFYFNKDKLYERQAFIRQRLAPKAAVTAYIEEVDKQRIVIQAGNAQKLPLEILEVVHAGIVYQSKDRILLNEKPRYQPMELGRYQLEAVGAQSSPAKVSKQIKLVTPKPKSSFVEYRLPGSSITRQHTMFSWAPAITRQLEENTPYNRYMPLQSWPYLNVDEANNVVSIKPGYWKIANDLVIPEGFRFVAGPETIIDLVEGARIVSFSPVEFTGTEISPIVFKTTDKSGRGIIILEAEERSTLTHVRFDGLVLADAEPWALTSVVTFHRSDVDIQNCFFGNNDSEDSLNIIRSNFIINGSEFKNTRGDAFDSDFSNGLVENTKYIKIGNDSIDVSGTEITVRKVVVQGAGDKGISVGEASRMEAENLSISGVNIGVAAKDLSHFEGMTINIRNSNVGFTLFQKKPEYGPATAATWRTQLSNVREQYWLEEDSSLSWEGLPVKANKTALREVLYAEEYVPETLPSEEAVAQ